MENLGRNRVWRGRVKKRKKKSFFSKKGFGAVGKGGRRKK